MSEQKLYELKRDIWTPSIYIRAGFRKTEAEWKERLGEFDMKLASDWFIDVDKNEAERPIDELKELIDAVFSEKGLNSISYKEAAREIADICLKQNK